MTKSRQSAGNAAREQRLAERLRENLRRRKAQARALDVGDAVEPAEATTGMDGLSKAARES